MMSHSLKRLLPALVLAAALSACNAPSDASPDLGQSTLPDTSQSDPQNPPAGHGYTTDVMLFNGSGVSTSDWQSTESILKSQGLSYQLVNSAELNAMSLEQITSFGAIVVPGGSGGTITSNLTPATRIRVRQAVRDYGVGYVGFCAGAWVAVGPEADTDNTAGYGLAVAKGSVLPSWPVPGRTAAMVPVTFSDGSVRQLVWWGGPATPEWENGVVARYADGKPAISERWAGKGYVVISGPHPEAPQGWRSTAGTDSDGLDYDIAIDMIQAALKKQALATY